MYRTSSSAVRFITALGLLVGVAIAASGCVAVKRYTGPRLVTPEAPAIPSGGKPLPADHIAVLESGQQLVAHAAWGRIKIEAGPGMRRVYSWDGMRRGAMLEPRIEQFYGSDSLGLYFNGKPPVWASADGITKLKAEEGRHNFDNKNDALIWMQIRRLRFTYNDQGLAIGWRPDGDTLRVELWQFYIKGEKPTSMPKSRSDALALGPIHVQPQTMDPVYVYADGHREPVPPAERVAALRNQKAREAREKKRANNWFRQHIAKPIASLFGGGDEAAQPEQQPTQTTPTKAATQLAGADKTQPELNTRGGKANPEPMQTQPLPNPDDVYTLAGAVRLVDLAPEQSPSDTP